MSSRPSFRPRPIDSAKPLPIVRTSKDLRHEDDIVVSRALPAVGTGVDAAELEERHLQQALMASVFGDEASIKADIPVPVVREVEPPTTGSKSLFERPVDHYIIFDKSDADLEDSTVDYDADHEDETFVVQFNEEHKNATYALTLDTLERAMDLLEKLQGRALSHTLEELAPAEPKMGGKMSAGGVKDGKQDHPLEDSAGDLLAYGIVRQDLAQLSPMLTETARREIYSYWFSRRLSRGCPFSRFYMKPPKIDDPNPAVAFRPRGRENGAGASRRMNTHENYKRTVLLRDEFLLLESVLKAVIAREETKAKHLSVWSLQMRLQCLAEGSGRLEVLSNSIASVEREGYSFGKNDTKLVVSCRGLGPYLPPEIEKSMQRIPFAPEKNRLKKKKKSTTGYSSSDVLESSYIKQEVDRKGVTDVDKKDNPVVQMLDNRDSRLTTMPCFQQPGIDSYGFDDHGNRFLKHMRYFSGGFMNYGVSPYDHRVFAAASERNTVKDHSSEPKAFMFPNPSLKFVANGRSHGGKVRPDGTWPSGVRGRISMNTAFSSGSHSGRLGFRGSVAKRVQRPVKVRGRVGRGGRIILDRVAFEPEKGVKAASYPASVEMGGAYSAGLPFEATLQLAKEGHQQGSLGSFDLLGFCGDKSSREHALFRELQPMISAAEGHVDSQGQTYYWPSRRMQSQLQSPKSHSVQPPNGIQGSCDFRETWNSRDVQYAQIDSGWDANEPNETSQEDVVHFVPRSEECLRALPAYAHRDVPSVIAMNQGTSQAP